MSGALPGSGLLRIAERLFDRTTLEGAVLGLGHWRIRSRTLSLETGR
jgi:hypothetical protein